MPGLMIFRATLRRHGLGLLGHEDDAQSPLADLLQEPITTDSGARALAQRHLGVGSEIVPGQLEEIGRGMVPQLSKASTLRQRVVAGTGLVEVGRARRGVGLLQDLLENYFNPGLVNLHCRDLSHKVMRNPGQNIP